MLMDKAIVRDLPLKRRSPPYNEIEKSPAPSAVVGGRNMEPEESIDISLNMNN
jgi:hypothetical protein